MQQDHGGGRHSGLKRIPKSEDDEPLRHWAGLPTSVSLSLHSR